VVGIADGIGGVGGGVVVAAEVVVTAAVGAGSAIGVVGVVVAAVLVASAADAEADDHRQAQPRPDPVLHLQEGCNRQDGKGSDLEKEEHR
jgi:hypothetical protein